MWGTLSKHETKSLMFRDSVYFLGMLRTRLRGEPLLVSHDTTILREVDLTSLPLENADNCTVR